MTVLNILQGLTTREGGGACDERHGGHDRGCGQKVESQTEGPEIDDLVSPWRTLEAGS